MELFLSTRIHQRQVKATSQYFFNSTGGNLATLSDGVLQRSKILPAGPLPETNPKKIGFYQRKTFKNTWGIIF